MVVVSGSQTRVLENVYVVRDVYQSIHDWNGTGRNGQSYLFECMVLEEVGD